MDKIKMILEKMTLEEKIRLCSGADFWHTEAMEQYGIPSFSMADGPHGLRVQKKEADHMGVNRSEEATCFPAACAGASSWDPKLLKKIGRAIGEEALYYGVDVVLGPGVCMKRNPLCGRNFEYFSEDPFLAGEMAAAWIQGVQEQGVGTSLKHYAGNNQEEARMNSDSLIDERALREIYLPAFEKAVREGKPDTVMCSYNKVNGVFSSDNQKLLTDILRREWGFDGLVVTDWGAVNDRVKAFEAGCDLEMPDSRKMFDDEVKAAVENGMLPESAVDACAGRIIRLALKSEKTRKEHGSNAPFDREGHHKLAVRAAAESAVLLKNDGNILPLAKGRKVALCGQMAENMRYQGTGSSHIIPTKLTNLKAEMEKLDAGITYYPAYGMDGEENPEELRKAIEGAGKADTVVIAAGLPDSYESEGFDRKHMRMPKGQCELIEKLAEVNANIVVVLMGGSPMELPWLDKAKAVLNLYLGGQGAGEAGAELLYGLRNPGGKLAETWPVSYQDCPSSDIFGVNPRQAEYAESIYTGYRYYDKASMPVRFPFGYGLSYTAFACSDMKISEEYCDMTAAAAQVSVSCKVKNTGTVAGAEVVQLYVGEEEQQIFRAEKELKGFCKVYLEPGEEQEVRLVLDRRAFAHYDVERSSWEVRSGVYLIRMGASSRDLRLEKKIQVQGTVELLPYTELPSWYRKPQGKPSVEAFEKVYGTKILPFQPEKPGAYTLLNTFQELKENPIAAQILDGIKAGMLQAYDNDETDPEFLFTFHVVCNTPLIRLIQQGGGETPLALMQAAVGAANNDEAAIRQLEGMMGQQENG